MSVKLQCLCLNALRLDRNYLLLLIYLAEGIWNMKLNTLINN